MKRLLCVLALAGIVSITFSSYEAGTATTIGADYTGNPASSGSCGATNCHAAENGLINASIITVKEKNTQKPATLYLPGQIYEITVNVNTTSSLSYYGFQVVALKDDNKQGGSFPTQSNSNYTTAMLSSGTQVLEQKNSINGGGPHFTFKFDWQAPAGLYNGNVTFYAILAMVNHDGTKDGDATSQTFNYTFSDYTSVDDVKNKLSATVFPNPAHGLLNVDMDKVINGVYDLKIIDMQGKIIAADQININLLNKRYSLNTACWANGYYLLQLVKDGVTQTVTVVKH